MTAPVTLRLHVGRLDDRTGSPIVHRINDIDVDPAVVADVDVFVRWTWRQIAQHEQRAELLRRRVADLTRERDAASAVALGYARERDELAEESRRWRAVAHRAGLT